MAEKSFDSSQDASIIERPDLRVLPSVLPPITGARRTEPSFPASQPDNAENRDRALSNVREFLRGNPTTVVDAEYAPIDTEEGNEQGSILPDHTETSGSEEQLRRSILERIGGITAESDSTRSLTPTGERVLQLSGSWFEPEEMQSTVRKDKKGQGKNPIKRGVRLLLVPHMLRSSDDLINTHQGDISEASEEPTGEMRTLDSSDSIVPVSAFESDEGSNTNDSDFSSHMGLNQAGDQKMQNHEIRATLGTGTENTPVGGLGIKGFLKGLFGR